MVSINSHRFVLSALLMLALFPFALRAEEESLRAVLYIEGEPHSFSEKESRALKTLLETHSQKPEQDGMKEESKHYGLLKIGSITYHFHHGDIYNSTTKQRVSVPEKVSKKFISIYMDNKVSYVNKSALFAFILKDWISEEAARK